MFGRGRGILLAGKFRSTCHIIRFNQRSRVSRVTCHSTNTCIACYACRINKHDKNCNMLKKKYAKNLDVEPIAPIFRGQERFEFMRQHIRRPFVRSVSKPVVTDGTK